MGNGNQETNVDLSNLSMAELEEMEDAQVEADETGKPVEVELAADTTEEAKATDNVESKPDEEKPGKQESASTDEPGQADQPVVENEPVTGDEDISKHVSPPSKWAAQRAAKRELQTELDQASEKAAKADVLETELMQLKGELESIKEQLEKQGISFSLEPDNAFSKEKLAEVRDEYGDELADMMEAAAAVIASKQPGEPAAEHKGKTEANDGAVPREQTPSQEGKPDDYQELEKALDANESLVWWRSLYNSDNPNDPKNILWDKAVAQDKEFLNDPEYVKLSYGDRFNKVVETVSAAVERDAKSGKDGGDVAKTVVMPSSLSGNSGAARSEGSMDALDKVLAADTDKQIDIYNSLSEAERDKVDMALDI